MKIKLTRNQMNEAVLDAARRRFDRWDEDKPDNFGGITADPWSLEIEGAMAEVAFSLMTAIPWTKVPGPYADVGGMEVRVTNREEGSLIFRPYEIQSKNRVHVLLVGEKGTYEFRGWITTKEILPQVGWKRSPNGRRAAYFVPQNVLKQFPIPKIFLTLPVECEKVSGELFK